jgi:hypothetical protein
MTRRLYCRNLTPKNLSFIVVTLLLLTVPMLIGVTKVSAQMQPIPLMPLIDNEPNTPYTQNITNDEKAFMKKAFAAELAGDITTYNFDITEHNALICIHAAYVNDTMMMSSTCDNLMMQEGVAVHKNAGYPAWWVTLVDSYLKIRGLE